MLQKMAAVVLHTFNYNEKSNIVHLYTDVHGRMSFLIPATRSRKSSVNTVLFRPLSLIEIEADIRPRSTLQRVKEARSTYAFRSLPFHPYKSAIALFLSEFLCKTLREEDADAPLFAYLSYSIRWLDMCDTSFANFHLVFLMRLTRFLGIYPNTDRYKPGDYFDLFNACFSPIRPSDGAFLTPEEASRIGRLMRMNYETMHLFTMNRAERNRCLEVICEYYRLHLPDFHELHSLGILQELFGTLS